MNNSIYILGCNIQHYIQFQYMGVLRVRPRQPFEFLIIIIYAAKQKLYISCWEFRWWSYGSGDGQAVIIIIIIIIIII